MKNFLNFFTAALFLSLAVLIGCGSGGDDDDDDGPDLFADQAAAMSGPTSLGNVQLGTSDPQGNWTNFTLNFQGTATGGTYTTSNVPTGFETVWPSSGSWVFANTSTVTATTRDGDLPMTVTVNTAATQMTVVFTIDASAGRTAVVAGTWTFVMDF